MRIQRCLVAARKRFRLSALTVAALCCLGVSCPSAKAQPGAGDLIRTGNLVQDLSGYRWKLKRMRPGQGVVQGLNELPAADIETHVWISGRVPGDVYTDLWKAGVLEDPYWGRNSTKAQWVMLDEWWYSLQFDVGETLKDKVVRLEFDGVDYACDVWLNGNKLGRHEGMFSPFAFDVTDFVNSGPRWDKGRNILMVKLDPPPQVNHKVAGLKTPWFGDYWRDLVPFGIWRPVRLVASGKVRIDDVYVKPVVRDDGTAVVKFEVTLENHADQAMEIKMPIAIEGKNFSSETLATEVQTRVEPGKQVVTAEIDVADPQLWWPWDLGKPNLYNATIEVRLGDVVHHQQTETFGIRQIKMEWNPGFGPDEVSFPRTVMLNGKRHFIRSACWGGPPDIFVGRTSPDEYKTLIDLAKAANMNNIRIFGWHPPEIPEFYQYCDEAGLTVWQDVIPLGTANISQEPSFVERIYREAVTVIKERRNHPCLILIEGGEEAFLRAADPVFTKGFLEELGRRLQQHVDLPYVPDSPLTCAIAQSVGYKPKEAVHALAYFYSMGRWLMEDWYRSLDFPIVPELAITSVPSVESLKRFIPPDELWPPGPSWGHHWADLDRLRMQNFDCFGDERTGSLEEFVNATQDAQGTIFQLAVEHFRRAKPRCSGVSLCHFITYWPDMKWGIVDAYQEPKRSYEYVKRAYQPLLVSLDFERRRWKPGESLDAKVWLINDTYQSHQDCVVRLNIKNSDGAELAVNEFDVASVDEDSSLAIGELKWQVDSTVEDSFVVSLSLLNADGVVLSSNQYQLLIGDQEQARQRMAAMGKTRSQANLEYTYGNYYRFFPSMIGEGDASSDSADGVPRAGAFSKDQP
ncbi:glycosyl hydrolase 2 galactose-binding domain-containing protein [Crateriforma spongiae]|uniref:glycoside hydrolase family 2 protein n=1 Tax=Crateriforma spongiae TaxID=2724528 RepID=UPI0039B0CA27